MNGIVEKVKDIVEVRSHVRLANFASEPLRTLTSYHFTDLTAELMAKWLDRAANTVDGSGSPLALAGFRGVGKSHFIVAFGTILEHPDLRSRVSHPLISSTMRSIAQKRFRLVSVQRGTNASLLDELKDALAVLIGCDPQSLDGTLSEIVKRANDCAGDATLAILVDTSAERRERVNREDGPILFEVAEICRAEGVFIGIALDDDISGAEGVNSNISVSYTIDYLDQDHLYKIVDAHIFPKQLHKREVLDSIYDSYRDNVAGFRWSRERFTSLYPLHPSIMEIAPFVRLYLQDFSLLSFASEAGSRILGRPANSLIAPDEVFDSAEAGLRSDETLKDAFTAFDKINAEVVANVPIAYRLQAKLVLKGLFLFSLNDEGSSAVELGASMLIFDDRDPEGARERIESFLRAASEAAPDQISVEKNDNGELKYTLKVAGKDELKSALALSAEKVSDDVIEEILRRIVAERFADGSFKDSDDEAKVFVAESSISWRGSSRRGKVVWPEKNVDLAGLVERDMEWIAVIGGESKVPTIELSDGPFSVVKWTPDKLTETEIQTLKRFNVLTSDVEFKTKFDQHIASAYQAHSIAAERIFQRAFLIDGVLLIEGLEYNFTDEARISQSISKIFTIMLESLFEGRYPLHPYFESVISVRAVDTIVVDLLGGSKPRDEEVRRLAKAFGTPLGIVALAGNSFSPASAEALQEIPLCKLVLQILEDAGSETIDIGAIADTLRASPNGLTLEARFLLLSAMVAARLIEFVTIAGDRINHRSLDLKIIWDDVVGIALPTENAFSGERLYLWSSLLTKKPLYDGASAPLETVREDLKSWASTWKNQKIEERLDRVDDEYLNTAVWRVGNRSIKKFRDVAEALVSLIDSSNSVESALQRVAETFSDSEAEFAKSSEDLEATRTFVSVCELHSKIAAWMATAEYTGDSESDATRLELQRLVDGVSIELDPAAVVDSENLWNRFHRQYTDYFVDQHDLVALDMNLREKLDEIQNSDVWWEFEILSELPMFDRKYKIIASEQVKLTKLIDCKADTRVLLGTSPSCVCPFRLSERERIYELPQELWKTVNEGVKSYRQTLEKQKDDIAAKLNHLTTIEPFGKIEPMIEPFVAKISDAKALNRLTANDLILIRLANEEDPILNIRSDQAAFARDPFSNIVAAENESSHEASVLKRLLNEIEVGQA